MRFENNVSFWLETNNAWNKILFSFYFSKQRTTITLFSKLILTLRRRKKKKEKKKVTDSFYGRILLVCVEVLWYCWNSEKKNLFWQKYLYKSVSKCKKFVYKKRFKVSSTVGVKFLKNTTASLGGLWAALSWKQTQIIICYMWSSH